MFQEIKDFNAENKKEYIKRLEHKVMDLLKLLGENNELNQIKQENSSSIKVLEEYSERINRQAVTIAKLAQENEKLKRDLKKVMQESIKFLSLEVENLQRKTDFFKGVEKCTA